MSKSTRDSFKIISGYSLPVLTKEDLANLHALSTRFNIEQMRFTPGSQLAVCGLDEPSFQEFRNAVVPFMKALPANGTIIHSCNDHCRCAHEFADTSDLVRQISDLNIEQPLPAKLKIGVAGCYRCCTMVRVRDIGIFPAAKNGPKWNLSFGGNGGYNPRIGDIIAENLSEQDVIDAMHTAVEIYRQHGKKHERTARFISRFGVELFLEEFKKH